MALRGRERRPCITTLEECCQGTLFREDAIEAMGLTNIRYNNEGLPIVTVAGMEDSSQGLYVNALKVKGVAPFTQHYEQQWPFLAMGEDNEATPSNIKSSYHLDKIKDMIQD